MPIRKMEHVGIFVDDLNTSLHFYQTILGMQVIKTVTMQSGTKLTFLGFEGTHETCIELVEGKSADLDEVGKVHHLAFTVDDIENEVRRLEQHDIVFMDETPMTLPDGTKYIFFYGPNREHLELFQPPV
jgi:lactoylglutathione lyase